MKKHRFLSVFLLLSIVTTLFLTPSAAALEDFDLAARAGLLVEAETGEVLFEKNAHAEMYPASITKVMTALLVFEAVERGELSLSDEITADASAFVGLAADGSSAGIKAGEILTVEQLLQCMLIVSANEACNILAQAVCPEGGIEAFVARMNERAAQLGCENTHFANTNGLHNSQHYTSAWDIYLIACEALKHEKFLEICNSKSAEIPETNIGKRRELHSTNYLISNWRALGYIYREAQGIKTGHTPESGYCLLSSATRGSRQLISVVLGAEMVTLANNKTQVQSFSETSRLFDYGFDNFSLREILRPGELGGEVPVALSSEMDYVVVETAGGLTRMLPNDLDMTLLTRESILPESVDAPIAAGDKLGEMIVSYDGTVYGTVDLLALTDVSASWLLTAKRDALEFLDRMGAKIAIALVILLVVLFIIFRGFRPSSRRYGKRRRQVRTSSYRGRR